MVKVAVMGFAPALTEEGAKEHVAPAGSPAAQARFTAPLKPFCPVTVIAVVAAWPAETLIAAGEACSRNSGDPLVTFTALELCNEPDVAVRLMM